MAKLFNKKIKNDSQFYLNGNSIFIWWKQGEGYKESGSISCEKFSVRELGSVFTVIE